MLPFRYTKCSSQILAWLGFMSSPSYFVNLMQAFVCNCICSVKRTILNKRAPIGATLKKPLLKPVLFFSVLPSGCLQQKSSWTQETEKEDRESGEKKKEKGRGEEALVINEQQQKQFPCSKIFR